MDIIQKAALGVFVSVALTACGGGGGDSTSSSGNNNNNNTVVNTVMPLNDTGITWCANNTTNNLDCNTLGSFSGLNQDGEVGRDALAVKGTLSKVGAGEGGFDLTKIKADGSKLPANATNFSCVLDNRTGLMWEVKTDDSGLRDKDNVYQWDNAQTFVNSVNAQSLCSYKNWRLPTRIELVNIVDYGQPSISIEPTYFPNTQALPYWTSSIGGDVTKAWYVSFDGDTTKYHNKTNSDYIRLVRNP